MRTKILFFFLLLVMGVGNGFAENTSRDSLFQEITKNPRSFAKNWNTIPGSDNDKFLAILTGASIQIKDSVKNVNDHSAGVLLPKKAYYTRHIYYDETNKLLKEGIKFLKKERDVKREQTNLIWEIKTLFPPIPIYMDCVWDEPLNFYLDNMVYYYNGIYIYISYYLGTLCGIISLIYIFKDGIRERTKNLLKKTK